jgi:hypothetical protein
MPSPQPVVRFPPSGPPAAYSPESSARRLQASTFIVLFPEGRFEWVKGRKKAQPSNR